MKPVIKTAMGSIVAGVLILACKLLAARISGSAILEYLDVSRIEVRIEPCA